MEQNDKRSWSEKIFLSCLLSLPHAVLLLGLMVRRLEKESPKRSVVAQGDCFKFLGPSVKMSLISDFLSSGKKRNEANVTLILRIWVPVLCSEGFRHWSLRWTKHWMCFDVKRFTYNVAGQDYCTRTPHCSCNKIVFLFFSRYLVQKQNNLTRMCERHFFAVLPETKIGNIFEVLTCLVPVVH